jgi:NAD(P)-dependent dehydrogenase (short-subunit alcohol dehydrogenase family)
MQQTVGSVELRGTAPLAGRVALVTGGGRGLGAATCRALGEAGAIVVAADLDSASAERTAHAVEAGGGAGRSIRLDVRDSRQVEEAVLGTVAACGRLDALVNNAGVDVTCPLEELSVDDWDRVVGTNLRGPFLAARCAFPVMKAQGGGAIVNIVSTAARRAWANASAYHASKWGLLGLSHALHVEGRPHGIKVTAIVSGGMRTPFLLERFPEIDQSTLQDPEHVAAVVRFVLAQPPETVIPEVMVLPMRETSWP